VRILMVSRCLPYPLHEGDRLIVAGLGAALRARGHHLDLLALYQDAADLAAVERARAVFRTVEAFPETPRSTLDYLRRIARPFPDRAARCWHPRLWEAVQRTAGDGHDVVHFFGGVQVYEHRDAAAGRPRVIVPYESHALFLARARAAAPGALERARLGARLAMARRYERVIYRGFDRVVLISEVDAAYLRRLAPTLPVAVIPNGVAREWLDAAPAPPASATLLFVGNYAHGPNVAAARALATEVLPQVRAAIPEARAVLVGANPTPALQALAGPGVEVTGWVPDVRPHLRSASCMVAPITQGAGLRNKLLEAMAAGIPVVSTPLGCEGLAVTVGENILLGRDSRELAVQTIRVLRDPPLRSRIGAGGRALVERLYTWERVAGLYEALYESLTGTRGLA
jgi:glycosyltransferase involved in cell wall biosynthesis